MRFARSAVGAGHACPQAPQQIAFQEYLHAIDDASARLERLTTAVLAALAGWQWEPVGRGEPALKYLAAYVYRTAFSAEKIVADDGEHVTFTYRDNTGKHCQLKLAGEAFLHRFLQHVLPQRLQRVRHFGWLSAAAKERFARVRALLDWQAPAPLPPPPVFVPQCPCCRKPMQLLGRLARPPPLWQR